jgi:hypothetical protein
MLLLNWWLKNTTEWVSYNHLPGLMWSAPDLQQHMRMIHLPASASPARGLVKQSQPCKSLQSSYDKSILSDIMASVWTSLYRTIAVINWQARNTWLCLPQNISHKNHEISILTIKKRQSEFNTSSTSHREFRRRKDKTENKGPRNK